jgi:hypothetical protein
MSQDGLKEVANNYTDLSSQDFEYEYVYKRNKEYFQPLGKVAKSQMKQAEETLNEIELELASTSPNRNRLVQLSNKFYTLVPTQELSRPIIETEEMLREKKVMIEALSNK